MKRLILLALLLVGCAHQSAVVPTPGQPVRSGATVYQWSQVTLSSPVFTMTVLGHDGDIYGWTATTNPEQFFVVRITPQGQVTDFPVQDEPLSSTMTPNPDTNMYAIEESVQDGSCELVQITESGVVTQTPLPALTGSDYPESMVTGSDGNLWLLHHNGVARVTTTGGFTDFPGGPYNHGQIVRGPDKNLWVLAEVGPLGVGTLVQVNVASGVQTQFVTPQSVYDLVQGPDKNLYSGSASGRDMPGIYAISTQGVFTYYATSPGPGYHIVAGPSGRLLWLNKDKVFSWNVRTHTIGIRAPIPNAHLWEQFELVSDLDTVWVFTSAYDQTAQVLTLP